jgi:tRNA1Val (adenine37-N6)-methyltransferase
MGQDFFSFKQFTVFHNQCAMKVGIDGVLLGAWANVSNVNSVLDVGTGSGLISLMIAQRCNANIHAIDIDEGAVVQSIFNFKESVWANRLNVEQISLKDFSEISNRKFDLIISNPPFFVNSLNAPDAKRNTARHTTTLTHEELVIYSGKLLNKTGRICLILPVVEGYKIIDFAKTIGLHCCKLVKVFPKPNAQAKRLLIELSFEDESYQETELRIESDTRHIYSPQFSALVRDFYLKL